MSISVFVIPADEADYFAGVAREKVKNDPPDFHVVICPAVNRLVHDIGSIVVQTQQHIEQLDFHGHGGPGYQKFGTKELLFDSSGTGMEIARRLSVFLTASARVRLLGCNSVANAEGANLLRALRKEFGNSVTVQGSMKNLDGRIDYSERGFIRAKEEQWLFSTTDLDAGIVEAPSDNERTEERRKWLQRVREVMG